MATSHGLPPPCTCHTDLSVENKEHKRTYPKPDPGSFEEPRGWEGGGGGDEVSHEGNGLNAHTQRDHLLKTGNLPANYDY